VQRKIRSNVLKGKAFTMDLELLNTRKEIVEVSAKFTPIKDISTNIVCVIQATEKK